MLEQRAALEHQRVKAMEATLRANMARAAGDRGSRASRRSSLLTAGLLAQMEGDPVGPFVLVSRAGVPAEPEAATLTAERLRENTLHLEALADEAHAARMRELRVELTNEAREAVVRTERHAAEQHAAIVEQLLAGATEVAHQAEVARAAAAGELVDQVGREARGEVERAAASARQALEERLAQERASMEEQAGQAVAAAVAAFEQQARAEAERQQQAITDQLRQQAAGQQQRPRP